MSDIQAAIERQSDIILVTILVLIDVILTMAILSYSTFLQPELSSLNSFNMKPIQFHINISLFRAGIVMKSVILYLAAFGLARRLP